MPTNEHSVGIAQWRRARAQPRALLDAVGQVAVSYFMLAFERQGLGDKSWPERYPSQQPPRVNVAGVLADLNAGRTVPERRRDPRPVLMDTGRLRNSFAHRVLDDSTVEAGTTVEYATAHHLGLTTTQPVTKQAKAGLAKLLRQAAWDEYRGQLGFLFGLEQLETRHPKRPLVGWTPELGEMVGLALADAARRA